MIYRHFKMDNLKTALSMVRKDCFMSSIDLSDACYSVPVAIWDQNFQCFSLQDNCTIFVCLSHGVTSAPRLFTKTLKPVFAALHKVGHNIIGYPDDSILFRHNYDECKATVLIAVTCFRFSVSKSTRKSLLEHQNRK